jgi:hypothetical protein
MSVLGIVLIVILILVLLGGVGPHYVGAPWSPGYGFGTGGIGVLGIILIVVLILALMGRL